MPKATASNWVNDQHARLKPLLEEIRTYYRELPRLVAEGGEGKTVLIKGKKILGIWDTNEEAFNAGLEKLGLGVLFLAQPIESRNIERMAPLFAPKARRASK
jgi:hypothetical protein